MTTNCNSDTFRYKVFDRNVQNIKVNQLIELLRDPEIQIFLKNQFSTLLEGSDIQSFLKSFVDSAIVTSELQILKRLGAIEQVLGLVDYDSDETSAPTLPQRIESIEEKVNSASFKLPAEPKIQANTKTEKRAASLVNYAKEKGKTHLTAREITSFLKSKLPDSFKVKENVQNIRKVKQDVLKKAEAMFPDVSLDPSKHGHHEVRLVLGSPS